MELNKNHLSQEQFEVTQNCGTEPPFSGELLYEKREGIYSCVVCDFSLFESDTKFSSDINGDYSNFFVVAFTLFLCSLSTVEGS